jgi:hypothetical protein
MRNTADVIGGKPIAVLLQSTSGLSAINQLVAFYDIHGGKREVLFFYLCFNFLYYFYIFQWHHYNLLFKMFSIFNSKKSEAC